MITNGFFLLIVATSSNKLSKQKVFQVNDSTMKLYQELKAKLAMVGIYEIRRVKQSNFTYRNVVILLMFGVFFISATGFLLIDAKTFREIAEAFFPWMTLLFVGIGFFVGIGDTKKMFQLIDHIEKIVEKRKLPTLLPPTEIIMSGRKIVN